MFDTIQSAYENPEKILPFIIGRTIPSPVLEEARQYSSKWKWGEDDAFITFETGGFAGGTKDRPEFAARNYYEISQLQTIIENLNPPFERSAEIGSGYGRLSPWISNYSDEHYGVEPNREQLEKARTLYPNCNWIEATAQDLDVRDDQFDLLVSWTVLQHVPDEQLQPAIEEIKRTLSDDGHLILCEATDGESGINTFPRPVERYERLFRSLSLETTRDRNMEPTYGDGRSTVMVLSNEY